jgi:hypothetical protein
MPSSQSAFYPLFAPVTTTSSVVQNGNIHAYGTINVRQGLWLGNRVVPNFGQYDSGTSFIMDAGHIQIVNEGAYPTVLLGNFITGPVTMRGVTINTTGKNNSIGLFDTNTGHHNLDDMGYLCGTTYSGLCYYYLPSSSSLGFGVTLTNSYILAQGEPSLSQTYTPAIIIKNSSENKVYNVFLEGRAVLLGYDGNTGGTGLTWDMLAEQEAGLPMFDIYSAIGGYVTILSEIQDTTSGPLIIGKASNVSINCFNCGQPPGAYPVISGIFGPVTMSGGESVSTPSQVGENTDLRLTTPNLNVYTTGNYRAIGGSANIGAGQIANPASAPTVNLTTSCVEFPAASTPTYTVAFYDAMATAVNGNDTTLLSPGTQVTLTGSNCAQVTEPTAPTGAAYWTIFRSGFLAAANYITCGLVPISTTVITDENASLCGPGGPSQNTTILAGFNSALGVMPSLVLPAITAPTGNMNFTQFYMDSTALWPSFKPNGHTPYLTVGSPSSEIKTIELGSCTLSTGACSAQTLSRTYTTAPTCFTEYVSGTLTGILSCASTTGTVTPSSTVSTDSAVVNWLVLGN